MKAPLSQWHIQVFFPTRAGRNFRARQIPRPPRVPGRVEGGSVVGGTIGRSPGWACHPGLGAFIEAGRCWPPWRRSGGRPSAASTGAHRPRHSEIEAKHTRARSRAATCGRCQSTTRTKRAARRRPSRTVGAKDVSSTASRGRRDSRKRAKGDSRDACRSRSLVGGKPAGYRCGKMRGAGKRRISQRKRPADRAMRRLALTDLCGS